MIKYVILLVELLLLSSCGYNMESENESNITKKMSVEDLETIKGIFNGKILYRDEPSCGFAEDSSISLDDGAELYYISYDTCPVVYDKNRNRYFRISEKDNDIMRSMLREYGCLFNY